MSHIRAIASHGALALLEAGIIALLIGALVVAPALAAKGGNGGKGGGKAGGTITLVVLDGVDATPNHGERVAFEVATDATDRPFVGVRCWQDGAFVLDGYTGYFESYMFEPWVWLDSPYWTAGVPADCSARLFHYDRRGNQKVLATVDFAALP